MIRMFVWHRVRNYPKWRKEYDAFWRNERSKGVEPTGVFQDVTDPNSVTVCHDFTTLARAWAFAGSARLRKGMKKAGVRGTAAIWFAKETRKTPQAASARRPRRARRRARHRR